MVGILIVSHGDFAAGLLNAVELIAGRQEKVTTIGLHHEDGVEEFESKVNQALKELDEGDGVLAFVDILGGTPSNVIFRSLAKKKFKAIAGMNMAMVVQAVMMRDSMEEEELYESVLEVAKQPPILLHEMYQDMIFEEAEEDDI
ncbi:MAG TPA: PTS sugar transporter subunit IIA [Candidatus Anaerostipes avistercoris]|uniref:PTS sugar transporter subunit IIA n=1 Tax=Candidatus Anaerostipes avistercoris TaxID=2838462 RepID=A0A9D2PEB9_9FIRM|nr:PTS sugar transporter subunit IIA [uncultured Anaerostipes sp.]HJC49210.1 PTS sugar transporter subunit IIA [Candidatus Anaerostipes avistercoris]